MLTGRPLLIFTLLFALGIVLARYFPLADIFLLSLFAVSLIAALLLPKVRPVLLFLAAFFFGALLFQLEAGRCFSYELSDPVPVSIQGEVITHPRQEKERTILELNIKKIEPPALSRLIGQTVRTNLALAGERSPAYGDQLLLRGTLFSFAGFANPGMPARERTISLKATDWEQIGWSGNPLVRTLIDIRIRLLGNIQRLFPEEEALILGSLLLGRAAVTLPSELSEKFRQAGLVHLLVVSGMHLAAVSGAGLVVFKLLRLPPGMLFAATSGLIWFFALLAGGTPSVLRAALMTEAGLLGKLLDRRQDFYTTIALAALILLIWQPSLLFNIGWQLSFAATLSLFAVAPILEKRLPSLLAVSLAPTLITAPLIALNFNQITPGAVLANLLVLPWVAYLVVGGFIFLLLSMICLAIAQPLSWLILLFLITLKAVAEMISRLPGSYLNVATPSGWLILIYYGLVGWFLYCLDSGRRFFSVAVKKILLLVLLAWIFWSAFSPLFLPKEIIVNFLDVGQGDAIAIKLPRGDWVVVDGGGLPGEGAWENNYIGERVLVPWLRRQGVNRIALVVLTHADADHLYGLISLLKNFPVDLVVDNGFPESSTAYRRFRDLINQNKIKYSFGRAGQQWFLGGGVKAELVGPFDPLLNERNQDSLAFRLVYGRHSFLLTGDLEKAGEDRVVDKFAAKLRSTVLKVGHHGSRHASSARFLSRVAPSLAVISVGAKNKFGHPHQELLARLREKNIRVLRTDQQGAIVCRSNGQRLRVEACRP